MAQLLLPQLLVRGRTTQASAVLDGLPPQSDEALTVASDLVIGSAYALGRQPILDSLASAWGHSLTRPPAAVPTGRPVPPPPPGGQAFRPPQSPARLNALAAVWPVVSPALRRELIPLIAQAARASDDPRTAALAAHFALAAADEDHVVLPDPAELAMRVTGNGLRPPQFFFNSRSMLPLLKLTPAADRGELARRALASGDPPDPATWALQSIGGATLPLGAAVDALIDAAKPGSSSSPPAGAAGDGLPAQAASPMPWVVWFDNPEQTAAAERLCQALLPPAAEGSELPSPADPLAGGLDPASPPPTPAAGVGPDVQTLVSVAAAQAALGHVQRADEVAMAAVRRLRTEPPADPQADVRFEPDPYQLAAEIPQPVSHLTLLRLAAAALSSPARQQLAAMLRADAAADASPDATAGDTAGWRTAADAALLESIGRRDAALELLRAAGTSDPRQHVVEAALQRRLRSDGRTVELAARLRERLYDTGSADAKLLPQLISAFASLGRLGDVRQLQFTGEAAADSLSREVRAAAADREPAAATAALRALLVAERSAPLTPAALGVPRPEPGGLIGFEQSAGAAARSNDRPGCLSASDAGGVRDLLRALDVLPPEQTTAAEALAQTLADAAGQSADEAALIIDRLVELQRRQSLRANDRLLILRLATTPGVQLPPAVRDAVWDTVLLRSGSGRGDLAAALAMQGHAAAALDVKHWTSSLQTSVGRAVDGWVATVDRDDRVFSPAVPFTTPENNSTGAAPRPAQVIIDSAESDRLLGLIAAGQRSTARAEFDTLADEQRVAVGSTPRTLLVGARLAADDGDVPEFGRRFGRVLDDWLWSADDRLLDVRAALPAGGEGAADVASVTDAALAAVEAELDRWAGNTDLCRELCFVGGWAAARGDAAAADRALAAAVQLRTRLGGGEHELWIADLADRSGHPATAVTIQTELLQDQRLPLPRIAPLLRTLVRQGDADQARRLAGVAAVMTGSTRTALLAGLAATEPTTRGVSSAPTPASDPATPPR